MKHVDNLARQETVYGVPPSGGAASQDALGRLATPLRLKAVLHTPLIEVFEYLQYSVARKVLYSQLKTAVNSSTSSNRIGLIRLISKYILLEKASCYSRPFLQVNLKLGQDGKFQAQAINSVIQVRCWAPGFTLTGEVCIIESSPKPVIQSFAWGGIAHVADRIIQWGVV